MVAIYIYIIYILYMYIICTYECWFILNMEDLWSSSYHNPKFTTGHLSDVSVSPAGHTGQGWPIGVSINGGTPIAGWFVPWKIHLQMDDLGVSLFQETSIWPIVSFNCGQFRIAKGSSEEIVAILQHSSTFLVGG